MGAGASGPPNLSVRTRNPAATRAAADRSLPMTTSRRRAAAALAMATILLASCSSNGSDAAKDTTTTTTAKTTTTGKATTTTGKATTTTTTAATTTTGGGATTTTGPEGTETGSLDTLPSGEHYGYFAGIESGTVEGQPVQVLLWDEVQFLTGKAAVDAAHAHHAIPDDQDFVDDDYYIVNDNQKVRRLAIVPDAQVTKVKDGSTDQTPSSPDEVSKDHGLYKIEIQNVRGISTITLVEGVFLP